MIYKKIIIWAFYLQIDRITFKNDDSSDIIKTNYNIQNNIHCITFLHVSDGKPRGKKRQTTIYDLVKSWTDTQTLFESDGPAGDI